MDVSPPKTPPLRGLRALFFFIDLLFHPFDHFRICKCVTILHIIVTYIKVNIITELEKLDSLPRNLRAGNKLPALLFKKPSLHERFSTRTQNIHRKTWKMLFLTSSTKMFLNNFPVCITFIGHNILVPTV